VTDVTLASLRAFAATRERPPRCELCSTPLLPNHEHVLEPRATRLLCACSACARTLAGARIDRPRRIESFARRLRELELDDATWQKLGVPVGLAFFSLRGPAQDVVASLPGRAGIVETLVPPELWREALTEHPSLREFLPDVEALLVRRTTGKRDYFHVSIDHCFRLAGLLRSERWPISGPEPALVDRFFDELDATEHASRRSLP
jgi:hypothetical protein